MNTDNNIKIKEDERKLKENIRKKKYREEHREILSEKNKERYQKK